MKKTIIYLVAVLCIASCKDQQLIKTTGLNNVVSVSTPQALLTPSNENWKASSLDAPGYSSIENVSYKQGNNCEKIVSVKFEKDGNCIFIYQKRFSETDSIPTLVTVEGKAVFYVNGQGKNMFSLQAVKGNSYKENKTVVLGAGEIKKYASYFIWEKISFKDMPSEDFLLLAALDKDVQAGNAYPASIEKKCVSKFYSRK